MTLTLIKRYSVLAVLCALLGLAVWLWLRIRSGAGSGNVQPSVGAVLPPEDKEQIVVDPRHHTLIIKRPGGDISTHLPDRQSVIDIRKDGSVKVTAPQFGLEARAFVGIGYSDDARLAIGMDGLYWKGFDLGGGVGATFRGTNPRAFLSLSYNVKDNLRISVTVDHTKAPGLMLSVRI